MSELEISRADHNSAAQARPVERRPFQFGLRAMFVGTALVSVLFAIMGVVGPVGSTFLVWFLLLVAAHVSGAVWGTRKALRRIENDEHDRAAPGWGSTEVATISGLSADGARLPGSCRGTRLRESTRLGWPMIVTTTIGVVGGGSLGATLLWLSLGGADYTGVVLGSLSSAVVGGFLGFLTSSFFAVALNAWREAAGSDVG